MKISNLETATKLAKITGRPLEDFYEAPAVQIEAINYQQEEEDSVEDEAEYDECSTSDDISEIQHDEVELVRRVLVCPQTSQDEYIQKFGGHYSPNGKLVCTVKDMTKVEYSILTKKMTKKEVLNHPLLYVFFRAEEQKEGHFWLWLETFKD